MGVDHTKAHEAEAEAGTAGDAIDDAGLARLQSASFRRTMERALFELVGSRGAAESLKHALSLGDAIDDADLRTVAENVGDHLARIAEDLRQW
jgi:hypothetical protein